MSRSLHAAQRGAGYFPGGAACRYRRRILALGSDNLYPYALA